MKYDYLIVGCGCFGATFARIATDRGKKCLVIDKREHVGGNCYTEKKLGIDVHKYGAHIFHTSNKEVWDFVNQFGEFNSYRHTIKASNSGRLFSFPINLMTLYQVFGVTTPKEAEQLLASKKILSNEDNLEAWILSQIGIELYELFIKEYTTKQWKKSPRELPASIVRRMPIRLSFNDNYYSDVYQGIPVDGYSSLFTGILSDIDLSLGEDFFDKRAKFESMAKRIIYTGPIDQLFGYKYGKLEWRSLRFEEEIYKGDYQGCSVVNYTDSSPHTRICEHKHFTNYVGEDTIISKEFPSDGEPYYPIVDNKNTMLYNKYKKLVEGKLICGGRLGNYKYIDMHQAIGAAMKVANEIL